MSAACETGARSLSPAALSAWLTEAAAVLEAQERVDVLPLVQELCLTSAWWSERGAGRDTRAALAAGLDALLARLHGGAETQWEIRQLVAIVNLRSVRGQALRFDGLPAKGGAGPESGESISASVAVRVLPTFRAGLVGLLKEAFADAATLLADACREAGAGTAVGRQARRWRRAAEMFDFSSRPEAAGLRVAVTRTAMGLELLLRRLCAGEEDIDGCEHARLWNDVDVLHSLIARIEGAVCADPQTAANGREDVSRAAKAITEGAEAAERLGALGDGFLHAGHYKRWFDVWKLAQSGADRETVLRRLEGWRTEWGTAGDASASAVVHHHPARARIAAGPFQPRGSVTELAEERAPAVPTSVPGDRPDIVPAAVPVDEALLENLNFAVAEMRGARSRAEANLGSLRGGLQDMERTLRSLRTQLESLEMVPGNARGAETPETDARSRGVPPGLGTLARGIDELQRIQDALHALTEETESVLASQASEHGELEQGLLKTRLIPVSTQFERWAEAVGGVAPASLQVDGGDLLLERRAAIALSDALMPLLQACAVAAGAGSLAVEISRPKFDLVLQIRFAGGPIAPERWRGFAAAFEPQGAFAVQRYDTSVTTCRIVVPGPPQSLDALMVELGGRRFALPVDGVAGVARRAQTLAEAENDSATSVADSRSLAALLGIPEEPASAASGPATYLLLAAESRHQVACRVDAVCGRERVLARSPGPLLAENPWVLAVVLQEHAPPTLVLDLPAVVPALTAPVAAV